jgi:hypothetical protein
MGQNRTEIYPEVLHKLGLPSTDRRVSTDHVYKSINNALRKLSRDFDWPWLVTTETISLNSGDSTYTPPADWARTLWIASEQYGYEIRNAQRRSILRWGTSQGYPKFFSVQGNVIKFAPGVNRDMDLQHAYIAKEGPLDDDSTEVTCPDDMIDIVYLYAAIEEATRLKDATLRSTLVDELKDVRETTKRAARLSRPNLSIRVRHTRWF